LTVSAWRGGLNAAKDAAVFVEHRSFKDRGAGQKATKHQGVAKTNAERAKKRGPRRMAARRRQ
jgi:hypothetical protein